MNESFVSLIDSAPDILILLPQKPLFDDVAAALGLYLSLSDKKQVNINCPSSMTVDFNRLIGIDKISSQIGDKNLVISFKGYDAANIEKVSYDIDDGEFKLSVVPKNGYKAPNEKQINLGYSGISSSLVILIGGVTESDFPTLESEDLASASIAHIGTRALTSTKKEIMSFAKPGSSVSELVAGFIKENSLSLDPDIATNLIVGIEERSINFSSPEVTPDTFEVFADLLRNGGRRQPRVKLSPASFPVGAIPTRPFNQPTIQPTADVEGVKETEQEINPPEDWLHQPKVYKGGGNVPQSPTPQVPSENKG